MNELNEITTEKVTPHLFGKNDFIPNEESSITKTIVIKEVPSPVFVKAWLTLSQEIYQHDTAWVAPPQEWIKFRFRAKNPTFKDLTLRYFLAKQEGKVVATATLLKDARHEKKYRDGTYFFGFFETIDDQNVVDKLFQRLETEVTKARGKKLIGPRNMSRIEEIGLTISGHEYLPPMLANHHRPYYQELLESVGLKKHHDILAFDYKFEKYYEGYDPIPKSMAEKAAKCQIENLVIEKMKLSTLKKDLDDAHTIFVEAFRNVPDNTPLPKAQFVQLALIGISLSSFDMLQIARVNGKPAGFALCFPDLHEAIAKARGKLFPLGLIKALINVKSINTASFKLLGVMPEYRGTGLHAKMIEAAVKGVLKAGYNRLEASLIDERNKPSRAITDVCDMKEYKRYRLYEKEL